MLFHCSIVPLKSIVFIELPLNVSFWDASIFLKNKLICAKLLHPSKTLFPIE